MSLSSPMAGMVSRCAQDLDRDLWAHIDPGWRPKNIQTASRVAIPR